MDIYGQFLPANHALPRTRRERRGLQSVRPVRRVAELGSLDHMSIWLTFILGYLLFGLGCYVCIMRFFPPQDAPLHDPAAPPPTKSELREIKPLPFSLSNYLGAIPGLVLMFIFAPLLLILFTWQRAKALMILWSNKSLQATRDGAFSSASRFTSFAPACLSFGR